MWVCRAGKKAVYADYYLKTEHIYIPWEGFEENLILYKTRDEMKALVINEKGDVAKTSISNWAGQLYSFCWEMKIGDKVLIPYNSSNNFALASIAGEYCFSPQNEKQLWHSRAIKILAIDVPANIFDQSIRYSLGAFRTIFKAKKEQEIVELIYKYIAEKEG